MVKYYQAHLVKEEYIVVSIRKYTKYYIGLFCMNLDNKKDDKETGFIENSE